MYERKECVTKETEKLVQILSTKLRDRKSPCQTNKKEKYPVWKNKGTCQYKNETLIYKICYYVTPMRL